MYRNIISILLLFFSSVLYSQQLDIQFDRISVEQGLFDHSINCITQDHMGFIWIGGSDGLYKYDGYEFTYYQYKPGIEQYKHFKEVFRIQEASNGLMWILSETGIILFDPGKDRSVLLFPYTNEERSGEAMYSPDLMIDSDGTVWATYRNGVLKIYPLDDPKEIFSGGAILDDETRTGLQTEFIEIPFHDPVQFNLVTRLYEDHDQNILIGCISGLYRYDHKSGRITRMDQVSGSDPSDEINYVRSIVQAANGSFWIAAGDFLYNLSSEGSARYRISEDEIPTSLLLDRSNNLFLGTFNDIYRILNPYSKDRITFQPLSNEIDPEYYGYRKTIRDIYEDRSGAIWTAQDYYGITKFNLNNSFFQSYQKLIIDNFKSTDVNPILKDDEGNLWVGTYGGGLYKVEAHTYKVTQFDMSMQKNNIGCILEISPGIFWIGTSRGIVEFNTSTNTSRNPQAAAIGAMNRMEMAIWDLEKDHDRVYIATIEGLYVFNLSSKNLSLYPPVSEDGQPERMNHILSLLKLRNGELLAGTATMGILRIKVKEPGIEVTAVVDAKTLTDNGIRLDRRHTLFEDSHGEIWIGDYSGLHRLHLETSEITNYKLFGSINYPMALSITEDEHQNLWIGTHFGLCCFNKDTETVKVFDKENGLPITIHGTNSVYRDGDGRIYFGGIGGFYDFHPDSIKVNTYIPPVVITDILLSNQSLQEVTPANVIIKDGISDVSALRLRHNQNDLAFKFSSLDYNQPFENQYAYRLEGYQDQWIETKGGNRVATYMKLNPGSYVFRVKGTNSEGAWNEEGTSLKITILKPWWGTHLALAVYIIIALSGITGIFRWRLYQLKKERKDLEDAVNSRTREIQEQSQMILEQNDLLELQNEKIRKEEEMKSRFFSNISHEFRTPLSLIISPVEELLDEPKLNEKYRRKLSMIDRNSHRLLNLANQLLDLAKFDSNKMLLEIAEGDVMKHLNDYAVSFTSMAEAKSINYHYHLDHEHVVTWFDPDKIEKIVANLLSNAFKFTPVGGEIEFGANYVYGPDQDLPEFLEFSVKDTGSGIPEHSLHKIFDRFYQVEESLGTDKVGTGIGLSLSRELALLMHGDISIQSKPNEGSNFTVRIPLGKDHLKENEYVVLQVEPDEHRMSEASRSVQSDKDSAENEQLAEEKKLTLLIVDDNRDLRLQLQDNLESAYKILQAVDGVSGMKKALETIPDLIITDLMMPKMDGMEFCQKIREHELTSHIPIIMLTAKDTLPDKISGLETGADDYIPKPFHMSELKVRVSNLIAQRERLRKRFSKEIVLEPGDITITPADETFLMKAISVVEDHMKDNEFTLAGFYQEMNHSRSTMYRKLSAVTGQSPSEFIRTIRLRRAAKLLQQNFGSIAEVSYEVGFNSVSYFDRSFRKLYGVSPKDFIAKPKDDQG